MQNFEISEVGRFGSACQTYIEKITEDYQRKEAHETWWTLYVRSPGEEQYACYDGTTKDDCVDMLARITSAVHRSMQEDPSADTTGEENDETRQAYRTSPGSGNSGG